MPGLRKGRLSILKTNMAAASEAHGGASAPVGWAFRGWCSLPRPQGCSRRGCSGPPAEHTLPRAPELAPGAQRWVTHAFSQEQATDFPGRSSQLREAPIWLRQSVRREEGRGCQTLQQLCPKPVLPIRKFVLETGFPEETCLGITVFHFALGETRPISS